MAQVQGPTPAKRVHADRSKVLSITVMTPIAIRHTNADGVESLTLAYIIGETDYRKTGKVEDRRPAIFTFANQQQANEVLRLVTADQADQILAVLSEKGLVKDGKIVNAAVGAPPALPDVSGAFEDLDKPAEDPKE